jgi:hypothetical protein
MSTLQICIRQVLQAMRNGVGKESMILKYGLSGPKLDSVLNHEKKLA